MHDLETLQTGGYRTAGITELRLACPLVEFPEEVLELGDTLEKLDLSGTGLSSLPANLGSALPNLKTALFSDCNFKVFPRELAACPKLETAVFRSNGMEEVPEDALPSSLGSLILTNNQLTYLPASIGDCVHLQECMLAGNQLRELPAEMARCKQLQLLRLSSNCLADLPDWLFTLPELAYLSFASNPCVSPTTNGFHAPRGLAEIPWGQLEPQDAIPSTSQGTGTGTPALWHQSPHYTEDVSLTIFEGDQATDLGLPADALSATLAAGAHECLVTLLGRVLNHPHEDVPDTGYIGGVVTQLVPQEYIPLSDLPQQQPPSAAASQPAAAESAPPLDPSSALQLLTGLAGALHHLHARGLSHGALHAHSILASAVDAHALLPNLGAATVYHATHPHAEQVEKIEVLAFGKVVGEVLERLMGRCNMGDVGGRVGFAEVVDGLEGLVGWRGMMRIPDVGGGEGQGR
ncbi:hypothetical protein C8A05DRAFT_43203 [Staphylotrichum tortipilum]|uniref:Uncharacterized protein n=1 Tax=Staphylotrichum tortipilum TaxID=2831512 RepID=A0AAN6MME7_9PEZI|nr:hypothetical protein C8A05DRAFT_43203 [Staphylotrichum longicolle]